MSRSCTRSGHRGQRAYSCLVAAEGLCTNADDYWGRYLGWPDLLIYRGAEYRMVEVKSSSDKLSDDQKRWIRDNHEILKLPFKLVKLRKKEVRDLD